MCHVDSLLQAFPLGLWPSLESTDIPSKLTSPSMKSSHRRATYQTSTLPSWPVDGTGGASTTSCGRGDGFFAIFDEHRFSLS